MAFSGPPPGTPNSQAGAHLALEVPIIDDDESLCDVVKKLIEYISHAIDAAYTFEQLRTQILKSHLKPLITSLSDEVHHPGIVAALLICKWIYANQDSDNPELTESRSLACEIVAWHFLTYLSERELVEYLLDDLSDNRGEEDSDSDTETGRAATRQSGHDSANERTGLLERPLTTHGALNRPPHRPAYSHSTSWNFAAGKSEANDPTAAFIGLNALEVAAVAGAKKFLSQTVVQKVVTDIWNGRIIFWEAMSVQAKKKAHVLNKRTVDPYSRLRVPKYQKAFQVGFFAIFLALYYAVLVERNPYHITPTEVFLYIWLAAFTYDEFGEYVDAGALFYQTDFWTFWDLGIIITGAAFLIARVIGLTRNSDRIIDMSFDILSLEALFMVPRICSSMSLNQYFGSLIPVLKKMTKDFLNFIPIVLVLYIGFLTTFTMLARDQLSLKRTTWILMNVFFGSSYLGFDIATKISPVFGVPLMLVFVSLTNILLITSLISLLSNSLAEVMAHAREEYLYQLSIYVLESSTSRRLTYFVPPLNLLALIIMRPLRIFLPAETVRRYRILMLKATHLPFVGIIWAYESSQRYVQSQRLHSPPSTNRNGLGSGGGSSSTGGGLGVSLGSSSNSTGGMFVGQGSLPRSLGAKSPRLALSAARGLAAGFPLHSTTSSRERRAQTLSSRPDTGHGTAGQHNNLASPSKGHASTAAADANHDTNNSNSKNNDNAQAMADLCKLVQKLSDQVQELTRKVDEQNLPVAPGAGS